MPRTEQEPRPHGRGEGVRQKRTSPPPTAAPGKPSRKDVFAIEDPKDVAARHQPRRAAVCPIFSTVAAATRQRRVSSAVIASTRLSGMMSF